MHERERGSKAARGALVIGLLAAALGSPSADASPAAGTYTVTAARSGSVDVAFARPTTVDMGRSRVTGSGSYAGYYFQPLTRAPESGHGELFVTGFRHSSFARFAMPLGDAAAVLSYRSPDVQPPGTTRQLPAGRYRLHVLGDAATRVQLRLTGAPSRTLRTTRSSDFRATTRDVTSAVQGPALPAAVVAEAPFAVGSDHSLTFLAMYFAFRASDKAFASHWQACLGPSDLAARCQAGGPASDAPYTDKYAYAHSEYRIDHGTTLMTGSIAYGSYYRRGAAPTGERAASYYAVTDALIDKAVVAAFSLAY